MTERKLIKVYVTVDRQRATQVSIPMDIDEVQLKAQLRDLGYISSYRNSYLTTKVYLDDNGSGKEICTNEYRSLQELGIKEGSGIIIVPGEPEPRPIYRDPFSMRCLYGCPMAQSVENAITQAERYSDYDSSITTGSIYEFD